MGVWSELDLVGLVVKVQLKNENCMVSAKPRRMLLLL